MRAVRLFVPSALLVSLAAAFAVGCASKPRPKPALVLPKAKKGKRAARAVPKDAVPRSEREPVLEDPPDLAVRKAFEKRIDEPAVALVSTKTPPRVTSISLSETARGEAPGMRGEEQQVQATLKQGQHATMRVTIAPGACATFIAQGGLGAIEVDTFLTLADRRGGLRVLAQDVNIGPIAVIGGHGKCFENDGDDPIVADLHVSMRRGEGVVLVRGFRGGG
jgi:hypothetical protein